MSSSPISSESALAESLRPRPHGALQQLNHASPCLPALEKTCQKILSLTGGLTVADRLAQIISRDLALSYRVLQISNSIAYSPHQVIASIPHAVSWLGLNGPVTCHRLPTDGTTQSRAESPAGRQRGHRTGPRRSRACQEPAMALEYPSLSQFFSATLLYSIGDLAIASQSQDLYISYRRIPLTAKMPAARIVEETQFYGVPRLRIAQALGQMWALHPVSWSCFQSKGLRARSGGAPVRRGSMTSSSAALHWSIQ